MSGCPSKLKEVSPTLIVLTGATGVGKTSFAIALARHLGSDSNPLPILSADSRQIYRGMPIGTATPTEEEQRLAPHYFIATHEITEQYSAGRYELEVMELLERLFRDQSVVILCGGSMLYIDAVCSGIDDIPPVDLEVRAQLHERYQREGLAGILAELQLVDPLYYHKVDHCNHRRVMHALEVYLSSGAPLSSYHSGTETERPFRLLTYALTRPREELYDRIDQRVEMMIEEGLVEEAKALYPHRQLNALNTVGYKELFAHFDTQYDLTEAVRLIQRNSRHFARKQLTWQRRHPEFAPLDLSTPWEPLLERIQQDLFTHQLSTD